MEKIMIVECPSASTYKIHYWNKNDLKSKMVLVFEKEMQDEEWNELNEKGTNKRVILIERHLHAIDRIVAVNELFRHDRVVYCFLTCKWWIVKLSRLNKFQI